MNHETLPAQGPVDVLVREQACENLAPGEGWTLAQLRGRLLRKVYPDGVEVVSLDGTDVLELHPVRFEQVTEGGAIKIKAVQSYRLLLRPNAELTGRGASACEDQSPPDRAPVECHVGGDKS